MVDNWEACSRRDRDTQDSEDFRPLKKLAVGGDSSAHKYDYSEVRMDDRMCWI
jgi:hypothetical protein